MARGERAPAILESVPIRSSADRNVDRLTPGGVRGGLAACNEIRARAADRVFDNVGKEGTEADRDEKGEVGGFVLAWLGAEDHRIGENKNAERNKESVDEIHDYSDPKEKKRRRRIILVKSRHLMELV